MDLSFSNLCPRFSPMEASVVTIYASFGGLCLSIEISRGIDTTKEEIVVTLDSCSNKMRGRIVALRPRKTTEQGFKSRNSRYNIKMEVSNVTLDLSMRQKDRFTVESRARIATIQASVVTFLSPSVAGNAWSTAISPSKTL